MGNFIIIYDAGYGEIAEIHEVEDDKAAQELAYEIWNDEIQSYGEYYAIPYTKELAEDYGLEEEEE